MSDAVSAWVTRKRRNERPSVFDSSCTAFEGRKSLLRVINSASTRTGPGAADNVTR